MKYIFHFLFFPRISHKIGFPLPTMFFGSNRIEVLGPNGFELHLDPIEVIHSVSKSAESVSVTIAAAKDEFWRKKSAEEQIFDYDWTFTPQSYYGSMKGHSGVSPSTASINYARLKQQEDPILFFEENILYEDELGDNGISLVSAKIVSEK
jgi:type 2A phosphatase activator TIP41